MGTWQAGKKDWVGIDDEQERRIGSGLTTRNPRGRFRPLSNQVSTLLTPPRPMDPADPKKSWEVPCHM
jgi:hypothetical protein